MTSSPLPAPAGGPTIADVGEAGLLERLLPWLTPSAPGLVVGAGDDATVWQPPLGHAIVTTVDSLVEGVHFAVPLSANTAIDLGWRLLAVSLSDLAAMGASPGPAVIALALPGSWPVAWAEALYQGLAECSAQFEAPIAGGNISASATAVISSTCLGSADPSLLLRRDGARDGWELAITGPVGAAAAALTATRSPGDVPTAWRLAGRPTPRLEAGALLASTGVRVAMDVSDGLFVDAARLLEVADSPGLLLDQDALPVAAGIRERWPREWVAVAGGGEDYELIFAAPPAVIARACVALRGVGLDPAVIGHFDRGPGLRMLADGDEVAPPVGGHAHYRG
ncbi:MAG TPA: thiamine-phosphate kinase [Candidatus Dormibacteraeota bacterium]|jgi:thiamine-monophosphate kinase